jgi:hypothetical protein
LSDPKHLPSEDVEATFQALRSELPSLVVVGGQALNVWAARYRERIFDDRQTPPTSKDVDLQGSAEVAIRCAGLVNGTIHFRKEFRSAPAFIAWVEYTTLSGIDTRLDFLANPYGLTANEVAGTAVSVGDLRIMHPLQCMKSRVFNVVEIPKMYATASRALEAVLQHANRGRSDW